MKKLTLEWFYAAVVRAIRTVAQTALGMFTVGAAMNEINWQYVISVSVVAGIYSILTSVATGLPETTTNGTLEIDTTTSAKDIYRLNLDAEVETLNDLKYVTLKVDPTAKLDTL